jgi:hypothetical protein
MAYATVAVAAVDVARIALLDSAYDHAMRNAQPVARDIAWEIVVADEAFLRFFGAHVGHEALMGSFLVRCLTIAAVASDAA